MFTCFVGIQRDSTITEWPNLVNIYIDEVLGLAYDFAYSPLQVIIILFNLNHDLVYISIMGTKKSNF